MSDSPENTSAEVQKIELDPNKELIVIAEDSAPNRKILEHLLRKLDYEVLACENGKEAWEHIESGQIDHVKCVISDIMMPELDGIQLLKNVRNSENLKDLPFILVTAVSDRDYILEAKNFNVNGYILKPVTFQRVTGKLQELFPEKKFPKAA